MGGDVVTSTRVEVLIEVTENNILLGILSLVEIYNRCELTFRLYLLGRNVVP
jgi:hypothetical protein